MHISKVLVRKDCEHLLYVRVIICSWRCRVFIMRRAFKHPRWNFAAAVTSIPPTHHTEKKLKRRFDKLCSNRSTRTWNDSHHHYHHDSQEHEFDQSWQKSWISNWPVLNPCSLSSSCFVGFETEIDGTGIWVEERWVELRVKSFWSWKCEKGIGGAVWLEWERGNWRICCMNWS